MGEVFIYDRNPHGKQVLSKAAGAQIARGMLEDILKFYEVLIEKGYAFFVISGRLGFTNVARNGGL